MRSHPTDRKGQIPQKASEPSAPPARWIEFATSAPTLIWFTLLFIAPTLLVFAISFKSADSFGTLNPGWTAAAWRGIIDREGLILIARTLFVSFATAAICLAFSVPTVYYMIACSRPQRFILLLAFITPFWTSFLVRIFAWKYLLHPEGLIKGFLVSIGVIAATSPLLYSTTAVLIVMVYSFLPFAILPLYAAAERFEWQLLEAATDLGATRARAFFAIFIPSIRRGISRAFSLVFIPSIGSYVIPDLVGGVDSDILGNKIMQRTLIDRNLPQASALSTLLFILLLCLYGAVALSGALMRRMSR